MKADIQLEQIIALLPEYICLYYVDYNDNLSHKIDTLQACISENSWDKLHHALDDFLSETLRAGLDCYKNELIDRLVTEFNITNDEADKLVYDTYQDSIEETLYNKDRNDAVKDLLDNTRIFSLFMDTGLSIEDGSWNWSRNEQTKWLKKIKRKLRIESNQWDNQLRVMLSQASYGGQLVVYFYDSMVNLITDKPEKDWKSVQCTNPIVAVINTGCGAGDHTQLSEHTLTMAFNRKNLFIDNYFKYSYVSEVCGMSQDWCEDTKVTFSFDSVKGRKSTRSPLAAKALQDRKYTEKFKQGKCSFGDMDISRHRDVYYINHFPCGSKCPHCGTFWID